MLTTFYDTYMIASRMDDVASDRTRDNASAIQRLSTLNAAYAIERAFRYLTGRVYRWHVDGRTDELLDNLNPHYRRDIGLTDHINGSTRPNPFADRGI